MRSTVGPSVDSAMTPPGFPPDGDWYLAIAWQYVATSPTLPPAVRNGHDIPYGIARHPPELTGWRPGLRHICLRTVLSLWLISETDKGPLGRCLLAPDSCVPAGRAPWPGQRAQCPGLRFIPGRAL